MHGIGRKSQIVNNSCYRVVRARKQAEDSRIGYGAGIKRSGSERDKLNSAAKFAGICLFPGLYIKQRGNKRNILAPRS